MSTYWGYRCLQCAVDSPSWLKRGDDDLASLLAVRDAAVALYTADIDRLVLKLNGADDRPSPFWFLGAHQGHPLVVVSEYGDIRGQT